MCSSGWRGEGEGEKKGEEGGEGWAGVVGGVFVGGESERASGTWRRRRIAERVERERAADWSSCSQNTQVNICTGCEHRRRREEKEGKRAGWGVGERGRDSF